MRGVCAFQVGSLAHTKLIGEGINQLLEGKGDSSACVDPLREPQTIRLTGDWGRDPRFKWSLFSEESIPNVRLPLLVVYILC